MVRSWSLVLRFISSTALVCLASVGLSGTASAQTTDLHFKTAITQVYGSQYPITGRLDLQVFPAGNLRGYYHTSYEKLYIPVVGGRDGNYIWFDIGPSTLDLGLGAGPQGKLHVVGSLNADGSFSGQVYPENAAVNSGFAGQVQFPSPGPGTNDQYVFAATPTTDVEPSPMMSGPP
jgi:hypothetical protein